MRITSSRFAEAVHAQQSGEVLLPLVELSHPNWVDPIFLVRDLKPLVHSGQEYSPAGFEISLPDDVDQGTPVMNWSIDNTDLSLVAAFRTVRDKIYVVVKYVLASTPDFVEAGPFDMELTQVEYTADAITGALTVEPILEEQAGYLAMTPATTPGLF